MQVFNYIAKEINKLQLEGEILDKVVSYAIRSIEIIGDIIVTFEGDITPAEEVLLATVVADHVPLPEEEPAQIVQLSNRASIDQVPYVYPTTLPQGWYTCFQGAGDIDATEDDDGIGHGNKFTFSLSSKDDVVTKEYTFNEDIYLKDGYLIIKDAPLGACLTMEIHHPIMGLILPFVRKAPLLGTARVPLNTSGRAFLPKGLIVIISVMNSKGGAGSTNENIYEDSPATFSMFGRFEVFRRHP